MIVFRGEQTTDDRANAKHVEKLTAHPQARNGANFTFGRQVERGVRPGEYAGEPLLALSYLLPDRVSHRVLSLNAASCPTHVGNVDFNQFLRVPYRKRAQTNSVD